MFHIISSHRSLKSSSDDTQAAPWSLFKAFSPVLCCAVVSLGAYPVMGQVSSHAAISPAPHQAVTATPPIRIVERESNGCGASGTKYSIVWTFDGLKGVGKFDISEQEMDIDSFDGHTLVVRRTSYSGGQVGSGQINGTAVYTGQITGTHIAGTASYYPVGRPASVGPWCGEIEDPRVLMPEALAAKQPLKAIPPQIVECELDQYCDGLWSLNGASGKAVWHRNPVFLADLTVESFTPDKIVIRRIDTAPQPQTTVYTGKLEGNRIIGMAEATRAGGKSVTYNWTATVPATSCMRTDGLKPDTQEALDVGRSALRFNLLPAALDCYLIAAKNGDAVAQNMVAGLLVQGGNSPIKQDDPQAFYWISKSAAQGNYFGEQALADMYKDGLGTDVDPVKAQYWSEQAAASPEAIAIAQNVAQNKARATQQRDMFGFLLGLAEGVTDDNSGTSNSPSRCQLLHSSDTHYTYCP